MLNKNIQGQMKNMYTNTSKINNTIKNKYINCVKKFKSRINLSINNELMTGADILVKRLEYHGVKNIFGYPGGASIPLCDSFQKSTIKTVLCRHEQAGIFMAIGYAKSSNNIGIFCATSGPGVLNTVTGIIDAALDSVPIICISGQVATSLLGLDSFQEVDIGNIVDGYCKNVFKITHVSQIQKVIDEALFLCKYGRPGPILIDISKDIQMNKCEYDDKYEYISNLNKYTRNMRKIIGVATINKFIDLIKESKRPVFYIGGGCINASKSLMIILDILQIPVVSTLMGLGIVSKKNTPYYLGMIGMHGTVQANYAVNSCDLLIAIGVRFDDRVTSKLDKFARYAKIIHIDIDSKEIGKNKEVELGICSDSEMFMQILIKELIESRYIYNSAIWYYQIINTVKDKNKLLYDSMVCSENNSKLIAPQVIYILNSVCKKLNINSIISTGVGAHQMFTATHFDFESPRSFLTSGGLGTMGVGVPYAIGAWFANINKKKCLIVIDGDGSNLMNIQEMATIKSENIPIKIIIINNQYLGMVKFWTDLADKNTDYTFLGLKNEPNKIYPDFPKIAEGFDIKSDRVYNIDEVEQAIIKMLTFDGPYLLDVIVKDSKVIPFIPSNSEYKDIIVN